MVAYYFSTTGSDSGAGTESDPYQTVTKVNTTIAAHSAGPLSILFKGGDTFAFTSGISISSKSNIILSSYGSGRATIGFTASISCITTTLATLIQISQLDLVGAVGAGLGVNFAMSCIDIGGGSAIQVMDCQLTGSAVGIRAYNTSLIAANVNCINPFIAGLDITGSTTAILDNVECSDAGVTVVGISRTANNLALLAGTPGADKAAGLRFQNTGRAVVRRAAFRNCRRGIYSLSTATIASRIYRSFIDFGNSTEEITCTESGVNGSITVGPIIIRDSVIKIGSAGNPATHAIKGFWRTGKGVLDISNCTISSNATHATSVIFHNDAIAGAGAFTATNCSCAMRTNGSTDHPFVKEVAGLSGVERFFGTNNNYAYAATPPATTPFTVGATSYNLAGWAALGRETDMTTFQYNAASLNTATDLVGQTLPTNGIVNTGLDLTTTYGTENEAPYDYYNTNRADGFAGYWSRGAHEPNPRPTQQAFVEEYADFRMVSPADVVSVAAYQGVPAGVLFPRQSHVVEATMFYEANMTAAGIFLLGDRIPNVYSASPGGGTAAPSYITTPDIVPATYGTTPERDLTTSGMWRVGQTPGTTDTHRVILAIHRSGATATLELSGTGFSSSIPLVGSLSLPTSTADGVGLKLAANVVSRSSTETVFSFSAWISYATVLGNAAQRIWLPAMIGVQASLSEEYLQSAQHFGLYGSRSTTANPVTWQLLSMRITDDGTAPPPTTGIARYKEFMAGRESVTNRIANGGFTSYPALIQAAVKNRLLSRLPGFAPQGSLVPVHILFAFEASNKWGRSHIEYIRQTLLSFVDNAPRDGSVIVNVTSCAENGDNGLGLCVEHIGENGLLTTSNYQFVRDRIVNMSAVSARRAAWGSAIGLDRQDLGDGESGPLIIQDLSTGPGAIPVLSRGALTADGQFVGAKKLVVLITLSTPFPDSNEFTGAFARGQLVERVPGLTDVIVVGTASDNAQNPGVSVAGVVTLMSAAVVPALPVGGGTVHTDYNDLTIPNGLKPVVLSTIDHASTTSAAPQTSIAGAAVQIGKDIAAIVVKRTAQYYLTSPAPTATASINMPVKVLTRVPGVSSSIAVKSDTPTESLLGAWSVAGCRGSIDINPQTATGRMISYDGGNVARLTFSEPGTVRFTQRIADIKPLLGNWITLAYSGHRGTGRVRVSLIVSVDGVDTVLDQIPSTSFGARLRRTNSYELPLNFQTLDVVLSIKGGASDSVGLSAVSLALGRYEKDLPFSDNDSNALASGAVVMYTGASCPPGFRTVPHSQDRLAFLVGSNPYELSPNRGISSAPLDPLRSSVDVVLMLDGGDALYAKPALFDRIVHDFVTTCPQSIFLRLAVVFTNASRPGEIVIPFTVISEDPSSVVSTFRNSVTFNLPAAVSGLSGPPPRKDVLSGLNAVYALLDSSTALNKLLFYVSDLSYVRTEAMLSVFGSVTQLNGFLEATGAISGPFGASSAIPGALVVSNNSAELMVYPQPSGNAPGELIQCGDGTNLVSKMIAAAQAASERPFELTALPDEFQSDSPTYLGGNETHDHLSDAAAGASLDDSDGFEVSSDDETQTAVRVPRSSAVTVRAYPFGSQTNQNRAGDRPVYAINAAHRHALNTEMVAMPPSFPIIFCEKL